MKLTAKEACNLMVHEYDIMFGVRERVYHQIQAAALYGQCGCTFSYPIEYDGFWEIEMLIQELIDSGYEVVDKGVLSILLSPNNIHKMVHAYEIYWAV